MPDIKFREDVHFEEAVVQALIADHQFAEQIMETLNVSYFNTEYLKETSRIIFDYYGKYKAFPSIKLIYTIIRSKDANLSEVLKNQIITFLAKVHKEPINGDLEYVKESSLDFCKKRSLALALESSLDLIEEKKYEEVYVEISKALQAGSERDLGHMFIDHFEKRMSQTVRSVTPLVWDEVTRLTNGGCSGGELWVIAASTGCHAKGSNILMFDGSFKKVEEIAVGELLMGPDSKPRKVLSLVRGKDEMYKIVPNRGKNFIVNKKHTLSLITTTTPEREKGEIVNITVEDYLSQSLSWKHLHKLYRAEAITFDREDDCLKVRPYHLGLILGDGCTRAGVVELTTADKEIMEECKLMSDVYDCRIYERSKQADAAKDIFFRNSQITGKNLLKEGLRELGLMGKLAQEKFIPESYKFASIQNRLELLAGLMDTDGHMANSGFDFCVSSNQLADDVAFIARSCGFYVSESKKIVNSQTYFRVHISGNCENIPTKIERKKSAKRMQKKNHLVTGFSVDFVGVDDYYGFTVDGDNLYVMDDFFVTHNCGKSHALVDLGYGFAKSGKNVVHYTMELNDCKVGNRYDARISGIAPEKLVDNKDLVREKIEKIPGKIVIKSYPMGMATSMTIKNHISRLVVKGHKPDVLIVDYADLMKSSKHYETRRFEEEEIYRELRSLAQELHVPIFTATQTNRVSLDAEVLTLKHIAECFAKAMIADVFITINRKKDSPTPDVGNMFIAKSRVGNDGVVFPILVNTSLSKIEVMPAGSLPSPDDDDDDEKERMKKKFKEFLNSTSAEKEGEYVEQ